MEKGDIEKGYLGSEKMKPTLNTESDNDIIKIHGKWC